jgi:hypothetical protein
MGMEKLSLVGDEASIILIDRRESVQILSEDADECTSVEINFDEAKQIREWLDQWIKEN